MMKSSDVKAIARKLVEEYNVPERMAEKRAMKVYQSPEVLHETIHAWLQGTEIPAEPVVMLSDGRCCSVPILTGQGMDLYTAILVVSAMLHSEAEGLALLFPEFQ